MRPLDPRLLRHARATRAYLVFVGMVGVALALLLVAQAALLARVITRVFLDGANAGSVAPELRVLIVIVTARAVLVGTREWVARRTAGRVTGELRGRLLARAVALGPVGLGRERRGELTATATSGIDALDRYFAGYLPQLVLAVVVPVVVLVRILPLDPTAVAIMVVTLPLIPLFMALVGMAARGRTERQWRLLSRLSAHFLDVVEGLPTLRAFGRSRAQAITIGRVSDEYRSVTMGTLRIAFLSALVLELLATLSVALVAVAVGLRVVDGHLALEPALTVLVLAPEVYLPLRLVGARFHDSMAGLEACDRAFAVIETEPTVRSGTRPAPDLHRARIRFDGVALTYPGRDRPALDDVHTVIEPGATVEVVGPSGAGKSTLAASLLRFLDPAGGRLLIEPADGEPVDLHDLDAASWRAQIAWLPQRPQVLTATIAENVRLARPEASDDEVRAALRRAGAAPFVDELPGGIDAPVGERGATLSVGQRQRLALARVFVRCAALVVVDEPTAHLDAESEAAVTAALAQLADTCTLVVLAHRPVLPSAATLTLVVDDGRIGAGSTATTSGSGR